MKKVLICILVLLLSTQHLVLAADSIESSSSFSLKNYLIISSSETWSEFKTVSQDVIVGPDATLTIPSGVDIHFEGDFIM